MANVATVDIGDYRYTLYDGEHPYASVKVIDRTKSSYGTIEDYIIYDSVTYDVTMANSCFSDCTSLVTAPTIPDGVTNMNNCFYECTSLTTAPVIPNSVTNMNSCFYRCMSLVNAPVIPNSVTNMIGCFTWCTSLAIAPIIPNGVVNMSGCFSRCTALTTAPTIPNSVIDMRSCFYGCTALVTAPTISNSVIDMRSCFESCASLTTAPVIPNGVVNMGSCFAGCVTLITAPVIPSSVTDISDCFYGCTSLITAPVIPDSVISMWSCFKGCTSLVIAPAISDSVISIGSCFEGCTSLSGDVYILCDGTLFDYSNCFKNTTKPIILHTYNYESELIATANNNNVTAGAHGVGITILNTRALTDTENASYDVVGGIRVDMLIDCPQNVGYLIGCSPSYMTLYDMNDNIINFGFGIEHPTYIRCYGVLDNTNNDFPVIPSSSYLVDISVKNVAPIYSSYSIELPSTAQSCKIIQDGETDLMSPRVNLQDIRFNPIGTNTNVYNVLDILRVIVGQNIPAYTGGMNSSQINKEDDIKHYVASADNIMVNETTTLQDYITNLYNSLS